MSDDAPPVRRGGRTPRNVRVRPRGSGIQGRPPNTAVEGVDRWPIDIGLLKRTASIGCTLGECAVVLGIPTHQLHALVTQFPYIKEAFEEGVHSGKTTLRRLQWENAAKGSDSMLIWLGKNILDQRDKSDFNLDAVNLHRVISEEPMTEADWLAKHAPQLEGVALPVEEEGDEDGDAAGGA